MTRTITCCLVVSTVLVIPLPAVAQRPGHLGQPPPPKVRVEQRRARTVPTWPRRADPTPLKTLRYLDLQLSLTRGRVKVDKLSRGRFGKATLLPRFRGRFEARLFTHGLLLDLVRFDFPLTAATGERRAPSPDRLGLGLSRGVSRARTRVRIPFDSRITRVVIVDTLKKRRVAVDLSSVRPTPLKRAPRGNLRTGAFGLGTARPAARPPPPNKSKKTTTNKTKKTKKTGSKKVGQDRGLKDAKILQRAK